MGFIGFLGFMGFMGFKEGGLWGLWGLGIFGLRVILGGLRSPVVPFTLGFGSRFPCKVTKEVPLIVIWLLG